MRRLTVVLLTGFVLVLPAAPAMADPAGPTNYRSTIESVEPDLDGIDVDILGGDAFLVLSADAGVTVSVEGYDQEPYLRFLPDGTVERNAASPARWLNDARYGVRDTTVPPAASADAPPRWEVVATNGTYAWHDHRIHWMSPQTPRQVETEAATPQPVMNWTLNVEVDQRPVVVSGELVWLPPANPVLPSIVFLLAAALGTALVIRRIGATTAVAAAAGAAAAAVGAASSVNLPSGVQGDPSMLILPSITLLLAALAAIIRRRPGVAPHLLGALAGIPTVVWATLKFDAFTAPIVPTALPATVARSLIAAALGAGLAAALFGTIRIMFMRQSGNGSGPEVSGDLPHPRKQTNGFRRSSGRFTASLLTVSVAQPLLLAHAGAGATWQALLVVMSLGLAVVFGLVAAKRMRMAELDDLVLPIAGIAIVSSLAPLAGTVLSDWVGWAFPIGVVAFLALLLSVSTRLEFSLANPATYGVVLVAAGAAVVLHAPITQAWHPTNEVLSLATQEATTTADAQAGARVRPIGEAKPLPVTASGA